MQSVAFEQNFVNKKEYPRATTGDEGIATHTVGHPISCG